MKNYMKKLFRVEVYRVYFRIIHIFSFLPPSENGGRTCIYWLRVTYCMHHRLAAEVPIDNSFLRSASTLRGYDRPRTLIVRSRRAAPGSPGCCVLPAAPWCDVLCRDILSAPRLLIILFGRTRRGCDALRCTSVGNPHAYVHRDSRLLFLS